MGLEVETVEAGKQRKPVADYVARLTAGAGPSGCRPTASNSTP